MYLSIHLSICKKTYVRVTYTNPEPYRNIASDFKVLIQALPIASQALSEDGSGVLEGQEFKFMCAYLGWSSEETNSIDVNADGTVTLAELQTFVERVGGVQKFFEQRRKRVSASRKDASEICPIVGVEVGARVRSHFFYKTLVQGE
eukprot:s212_g16.t1